VRPSATRSGRDGPSAQGRERTAPFPSCSSGEPRSGSLQLFGSLCLLPGFAVLFDAYGDAALGRSGQAYSYAARRGPP
jgi:hypothetical protein